jgi:hypothetical protein
VLAIFGGGVFHDTLFYGKSQFFIAILNVTGIVWNTAFLFIDEREEAYNTTLLFILGFVSAFSEFFISFLIPLQIAANNRTTYELTMAGTAIATVNAVYFLSTGIIANLIEGMTANNFTIG